MTCQPRKGGCSAATPCLVVDGAVREKVAVDAFCAGLDRKLVHEQRMLAYGKPAHHCLKNNEELARRGESSLARLRASGATLRVTGPVSDGFWVRAIHALSQATWARLRGGFAGVVVDMTHETDGDVGFPVLRPRGRPRG